MTDLHTHILPKMDDGARSVQDSIALLKREYEDGVNTVVMTPHFYPDREDAEHFIHRRTAAFDELLRGIDELPQKKKDKLPALLLGAELAWTPGTENCKGIEKLCYKGGNYLLVELPSYPWHHGIVDGLYDMMNSTGLTPVIAHIDRYFAEQDPKHIDEILSLGLPIQISTYSLLHFHTRRRALRLLEQGRAQYIITDCHDLNDRPPDLAEAAEVLRKKLGDREAKHIMSKTDEFLEYC